MNIKEENKEVSVILILLIYVLKQTDLEETFEDLNVAKVIFLNNCNYWIQSSLILCCLGTRKLTSTLKRKSFESSVGKMGCIDTVSGEEVSYLIVGLI